MPNCIDYNCTDLPDHLLNDCEEEMQGGSDQIVILDCDHQITDPSDGTALLAEITAGRAVLVQNVKWGMDKPSPITVASNIAGRTDKTVNYDRTANMMDGNVNQTNNTFYDSITNGRAVGGVIVYESGDGGSNVTWIDAAVQMNGGRVFPNTNTEFQRYEIDMTWKKLSEPGIYAAPTGVFS